MTLPQTILITFFVKSHFQNHCWDAGESQWLNSSPISSCTIFTSVHQLTMSFFVFYHLSVYNRVSTNKGPGFAHLLCRFTNRFDFDSQTARLLYEHTSYKLHTDICMYISWENNIQSIKRNVIASLQKKKIFLHRNYSNWLPDVGVDLISVHTTLYPHF